MVWASPAPCSVQATLGALAMTFQRRIPSAKEAPCWSEPSRGNIFLVSASPANTGHRLQMSRARQLGPQHIQSSYYQSEMSLGAADLKPLHSHSMQPGACSQSSAPLLLQHHLLLRKLECRKLPNQKHKEGTVPACSCSISQREDWILYIWQLTYRQSLYWQK